MAPSWTQVCSWMVEWSSCTSLPWLQSLKIKLMFLFIGRGYWHKLIESIVWAHNKLKVAPATQCNSQRVWIWCMARRQIVILCNNLSCFCTGDPPVIQMKICSNDSISFNFHFSFDHSNIIIQKRYCKLHTQKRFFA